MGKGRKVSYWVADCLDDNPCYSYRTRTKAELLSKLRQDGLKSCKHSVHGKCWRRHGSLAVRFKHPRRVSVEFVSVYDLIFQCLNEGGIE
jgi:hypothetical protein